MPSMRDRVLQWLAEIVWRRPWLIVGGAVALAIVAGGYAALTLRLNASTDDLISPNRPFMQDYRRFLEEFGDLEYLHAVIENPADGDPAQSEAAVDALAQQLRAIDDLPGVYSAIDPHEHYRLASRAMTEDELAGLAAASGAFPSLLTGDPDRVVGDAVQLLRTLIQSGAKMPEHQQEHTGAAAVMLLNTIAAAKEGSDAEKELAFLLGSDGPKRVYFTSESGRFYFISIASKKDFSTLSVLEEPLRRIRSAIDETQREFPDVNIGLTGKPVLQHDELMTSNTDMTRAAILAFVLCAALFMWSFGGVWKPLLAVVAFACATAWTYGFAAIAVGQLNLLSIVFMLVLIGVGLDYGVHVLARYREHRAELPPVDRREVIARTIVTAGRGNLTGAATSSAVFFMAYFTTFQGLRELGLIAGGGLLLCVVAMTVVLPALLVIFGGRRASTSNPKSKIQNPKSTGDFAFRVLHDHPIFVLLAMGAVTLGLILAPGSWRFEQNLLKLQAVNLDSVEWEHRILDDSAAASWFGAVICDDLACVQSTIERARQQPTIGVIHSVFDLIPEQTDRCARLRQQLHEEQSLLMNAEDGSPTPPRQWTADDLSNAAGSLNTMAGGAARRAPDEARRFKAISDDLKALAAEMKRGEGEAAAVRARVESAVKQLSHSLGLILEGDQLDLRSALPEALRDRCMSPSGKFLVMLHPKDDVWEHEPMQRFIEGMRAVDPNVTGVPITHFESLGDMRHSFMRIALLALLVIAALVWIDFRDWRDVLLAMIPTILGMVWLFETMAMFDISFNLANFFSVPILIGLSVDGSVHVLHRFHEGGSSAVGLGATRKAVVVTALTTTIGFGTIIMAHHRGLRSLGEVMAIGSIACLLATIITLPALLAVIERRSKK